MNTHKRFAGWLHLFWLAASLLLLYPSRPVMAQAAGPVTIEGEVIRLVSEHPEGQPIISHATVQVEKVLEGSLVADEVVITYLGGTVGELTLRVSHEPELATGMRIRVKLYPAEGGDYRIYDVDTDLEVLQGGLGPAYTPYGWHWTDANIPVAVQINPNSADVPGIGELAAVQNAMATWHTASCTYFEFAGGGQSTCTANRTASDGVTCVMWATGPKAPGSGAIATTFFWKNAANEAIDFDMFFWGQYFEADGTAHTIRWGTAPASNEFDIQSVALHELGHGLGLDHSNIFAAVMTSAIDIGTQKRSLHQDDDDGVSKIYRVPNRNDVYVDGNATGLKNGASNHPFLTVRKGFNAVDNNGNLWIRPGSYADDHLLEFNRAMTIRSTSGLVTINANSTPLPTINTCTPVMAASTTP